MPQKPLTDFDKAIYSDLIAWLNRLDTELLRLRQQIHRRFGKNDTPTSPRNEEEDDRDRAEPFFLEGNSNAEIKKENGGFQSPHHHKNKTG